jgi:NIMA (never in mitosis gene a)-related kinase
MLGTNAEQQCRKILEKNDYTVVRKLGKGGFGHVLLANKFTTCTNSYAIKCISLKKCAKDQHLKQSIAQETRAMSSLDHQHIVRLENNFSGNFFLHIDFGFHFLVMEFCDLGNLMVYQAKQPNKVLGLSEALNILLQVMKGTQAMHDCNIIHRDLKCENIFLKKNKGGSYTCKIGDFGFAKVVEDTTSTSCGTIYFMAPEVIANRPYDRQADIWSLGVILFYMLFG